MTRLMCFMFQERVKYDAFDVFYVYERLMCCPGSERRLCCVVGGIPEHNPCFTGRHGCDTNAVCRPAQGKEFSCECAAGFTGDGRVCYGNNPRAQIMMFSVCVQTSECSCISAPINGVVLWL